MRYARGRNNTSAPTTVRAIHFFRRTSSDRATCLRVLTMSIGYRLLRRCPDPRWSSTSGEQHDLHGVEQDQEVEEQRKILDVVEVVLQLLQRIFNRGAVAIPDLRPAGEPRFHGQPFHVIRDFLLEALHELRSFRPRPDEAHVTEQHIDQLRELVQTGAAEDRSHPRDARIGFLRPHRSRALLGIPTHGAELVENEDTAVLAGPRLAIEHGARRLELDGDGGQRHQRRRKNQSHRGYGDVEETLDDLCARRLDEPIGEDQPTRPELRHEDLTGGLLIEGGPILHGDAAETALQQRIGRKASTAVLLHHHHHIGSSLLHDLREIRDLSQELLAERNGVGRGGIVVEVSDDLEWAGAVRREVCNGAPDGAGADDEHSDGHTGQGPRSEPCGAPEQQTDGGQNSELEKGEPPQTEIGESVAGCRKQESGGDLADEQPRHELPSPKRQPGVVEVRQIEEEDLECRYEGQLRSLRTLAQPSPRGRYDGKSTDDDKQIPRKKHGHEARNVVSKDSQHVDRAAREQVKCQWSIHGHEY